LNNKTLWIGLGVVVAVFFAGSYLIGNVGTNSNLTSAPDFEYIEENKEAINSEKLVDGSIEMEEVVFEGSEFKFSPSSLTLKAGVPVKLVFKNTGTMVHDLVIDELNLSTKEIAPGEEETIIFTPDVGIYTFYCSVGNHRTLGMEGELIVE